MFRPDMLWKFLLGAIVLVMAGATAEFMWRTPAAVPDLARPLAGAAPKASPTTARPEAAVSEPVATRAPEIGESPDTGHAMRLPAASGPQRVIAPYIDIPAVVVRPNAAALRPYFALRKGLTVRYLGNRFSTAQPELIWVPANENGRDRLIWQSFIPEKGGLLGIYVGDVITLLDDVLYDFDVGTLFVKAQKPGFPPGYMLLETLIGETEPATRELIVAKDVKRFQDFSSVDHDGVRLYEQTVNVDLKQMERDIATLLDEATYATSLTGGMSGGVHPLYATSTARTLLFAALKPKVSEETRKAAIAAVAHFFDNYIEKAKVDLGDGRISWPYKFDWTMNWGIKLTPPWYSPYANSQVVELSALMFKLTGEDKYRAMAQAATRFITTPMSKGGAEYTIDGFRLPAEYVYAAPPMPNVRVLDGELGVAIALYNAARLLGDSEMLRQSTAYFAGLAMNLEGYLKEDGGLWFASYIENMPEGYGWPMWALLQNAAIITKDRRFTEYARRFTPFVTQRWCEQYGC
ncbi:MAG: hypothetical protein GY837_05320 [Bosea sp.]|uniref:D-glucuronyl C5-epimerase family protein n=2 Tax=Bosea sp. (in: a-proteobacteria) TaxID=1871050 RepID=UPI0031FECAE2|nr:hypothetical protein [Bosea sp. (in: a-proteobacteria)]